jgi:hypothetical protein
MESVDEQDPMDHYYHDEFFFHDDDYVWVDNSLQEEEWDEARMDVEERTGEDALNDFWYVDTEQETHFDYQVDLFEYNRPRIFAEDDRGVLSSHGMSFELEPLPAFFQLFSESRLFSICK